MAHREYGEKDRSSRAVDVDCETVQLLVMVITIVAFLAGIHGVVATSAVYFEQNAVPKTIIHNQIPKTRITDCDYEEALSLSRLYLKAIPQKLLNSSTIKSVMLNDNDLTSISLETFNDTPRLECLNLAGNRIRLEALKNGHPNLKKLILDYQRIPELSSSSSPDQCSPLGEFPNLTTLSLRGLDRGCLTIKWQSYPALTTIDFSDNQLRSLHLSRGVSDNQLKIINLQRNKFEEFYTDYIGNVEELYLDENPLTRVYIQDSNENLKILSLAGCAMSWLDGQLYALSLTALDLSRNQIETLTPQSFEYTPALERLNLDNNHLKRFPNLTLLVRLESLSLNFNGINVMESTIESASLVALSLRGNDITVIGNSAFSELPQLRELDLAQNRLQMLPFDWHFGMQVLEVLNLESNLFQNVLHMNVNMCRTLQILRIKNNPVRMVDVDTLQSLPEQCVLYVS